MPMLQHHQRLFYRHCMSDNDPELPLPILEDNDPREQGFDDLMTGYAPWSNTWVGWMFTAVMLTSTIAAVVWIAVKVWHSVAGP